VAPPFFGFSGAMQAEDEIEEKEEAEKALKTWAPHI
jgi:hypothetical protein